MKVVSPITPEFHQLTKDVAVQSTDSIYQVVHNDVILGYCESEIVARRLVTLISEAKEAELKEADSKWTKVLVENDDKDVRIYVQALGIVMDGAPKLKHQYEIVRVNALTFHKGIFPPPPPVTEKELSDALKNLKAPETTPEPPPLPERDVAVATSSVEVAPSE